MQTNFTPEKQDLLSDLHDVRAMQTATKGQRFGNYVLDFIFAFVPIMIIFFMLGFMAPSFFANGGPGSGLFTQVVAYALYVTYFALFEGLNNGRTIGKMITGTQAVTINGEQLTMQKAWLRALSRIVPFEPFSGLGDAPWHDKWTQTTVIVSKK